MKWTHPVHPNVLNQNLWVGLISLSLLGQDLIRSHNQIMIEICSAWSISFLWFDDRQMVKQ